MKERPILFSGPMVRAILSGAKTQTRRVVKYRGGPVHIGRDAIWRCWPNGWGCVPKDSLDGAPVGGLIPCPFGQPGDKLWVRERFRYYYDEPNLWDCIQYRDGECRKPDMDNAGFSGHQFSDRCAADSKWRPSIHMPRWASRITLEVTSVRVERLQDIYGLDVLEEGIGPDALRRYYRDLHNGRIQESSEFDGPDVAWDWEDEWRTLWESINGDGSWDANPWVWVVEFKRVEPTHA